MGDIKSEEGRLFDKLETKDGSGYYVFGGGFCVGGLFFTALAVSCPPVGIPAAAYLVGGIYFIVKGCKVQSKHSKELKNLDKKQLFMLQRDLEVYDMLEK